MEGCQNGSVKKDVNSPKPEGLRTYTPPWKVAASCFFLQKTLAPLSRIQIHQLRMWHSRIYGKAGGRGRCLREKLVGNNCWIRGCKFVGSLPGTTTGVIFTKVFLRIRKLGISAPYCVVNGWFSHGMVGNIIFCWPIIRWSSAFLGVPFSDFFWAKCTTSKASFQCVQPPF